MREVAINGCGSEIKSVLDSAKIANMVMTGAGEG